MMHDAVRADVLQALLDGRGPQYDSTVTDLAEHSASFYATLTQVTEAGLGSDVRATVDGVVPAVDAYLASAEQIIRAAGTDVTAARAAYPQFVTAFEALEADLPAVGEAIAAAEGAAGADAEHRSSAVTALVTVAVGSVALLAFLGWVVTRSVIGPLRRVGAVLGGLAEGDLRGSPAATRWAGWPPRSRRPWPTCVRY